MKPLSARLYYEWREREKRPQGPESLSRTERGLLLGNCSGLAPLALAGDAATKSRGNLWPSDLIEDETIAFDYFSRLINALISTALTHKSPAALVSDMSSGPLCPANRTEETVKCCIPVKN